MTDDPRWKRIKTIFDQIVEASPSERAALLEALRSDDDTIFREVESLLRVDEQGKAFDAQVRGLRSGLATEWLGASPIETGSRIGAWRVLRELGRGGMGIVLLVERADGQYIQQGALKLIKRGMDSDAVLRRFLRERQILARLEHRNIARLLDGGIADDFRPYFVMEYVDGVPLSKYCQERASDLAERLRLFLDVCAAVQFAHRQLVVHSDLKPSNILVNTEGEVKLLDFGIAKVLVGQPGETPYPTLTNDRPLTPAYAAPEQLRGEPVSTATDVYGLGYLLYELLTGRRPFDVGNSASLDDVRRILDSTGPIAPSKLASRGFPVQAKRLRGDLDTIALTALKREPDRRYSTVDALAGDIIRYNENRPIAAHREKVWNRGVKFAARNWIVVTAIVLALLALISATAISVREVQIARGELARADQKAQLEDGESWLLALIMNAAHDASHNGVPITLDYAIESSAAKVDDIFADQDTVRAALHTSLAGYFLTAEDRKDEAEREFRAALHAHLHYLPPDAPEIVNDKISLAFVHYRQEPFPKTIEALEKIEQGLVTHGSDYAEVVDTLNGSLVQLYGDSGDYKNAERVGKIWFESEFHGIDSNGLHLQFAGVALSRIYMDEGRFSDALRVLDREYSTKAAPDDPTWRRVKSIDTDFLVLLFIDLGRFQEARNLHQRAFALDKLRLPKDSRAIMQLIQKDDYRNAQISTGLGENIAANVLFQDSADSLQKTSPTAPHDVADYEFALSLIEAHSYDAAETHLRSNYAEYSRLGIPNCPLALASHAAEGRIRLAGGDASSLTILRDIADRQRTNADRELPRTLLTLAGASLTNGDTRTAKPELNEVLDLLTKQGRPRHPLAYEAHLKLADVAASTGDAAGEQAERKQALACAVMAFGTDHERTKNLLILLGAATPEAQATLIRQAREIAGPPPAENLYQQALQLLDRAEAATGPSS